LPARYISGRSVGSFAESYTLAALKNGVCDTQSNRPVPGLILAGGVDGMDGKIILGPMVWLVRLRATGSEVMSGSGHLWPDFQTRVRMTKADDYRKRGASIIAASKWRVHPSDRMGLEKKVKPLKDMAENEDWLAGTVEPKKQKPI
jgi:hypothetical protein